MSEVVQTRTRKQAGAGRKVVQEHLRELIRGTAHNAVPPVDAEAARAFRNTALVTVAALLLGLVGSVLGGWMASGEPMSVTYYRRRTLDVERPRRVA